MINFQNLKTKLKDWVLKWADSTHSKSALFLLAFTESSFFPIPPDLLLIAILMAGARLWWYYAGIALIGSLLGGIFGYFIGWGFYESVGAPLVEFYNLGDLMSRIAIGYEAGAFWVIFIAAFTPVPYKLITISAGLFNISFIPFIVASLIGRGGRFFLIAFLMKVFGKDISRIIYKYFNMVSILAVIAILLGFVLIKFLF